MENPPEKSLQCEAETALLDPAAELWDLYGLHSIGHWDAAWLPIKTPPPPLAIRINVLQALFFFFAQITKPTSGPFRVPACRDRITERGDISADEAIRAGSELHDRSVCVCVYASLYVCAHRFVCWCVRVHKGCTCTYMCIHAHAWLRVQVCPCTCL